MFSHFVSILALFMVRLRNKARIALTTVNECNTEMLYATWPSPVSGHRSDLRTDIWSTAGREGSSNVRARCNLLPYERSLVGPASRLRERNRGFNRRRRELIKLRKDRLRHMQAAGCPRHCCHSPSRKYWPAAASSDDRFPSKAG